MVSQIFGSIVMKRALPREWPIPGFVRVMPALLKNQFGDKGYALFELMSKTDKDAALEYFSVSGAHAAKIMGATCWEDSDEFSIDCTKFSENSPSIFSEVVTLFVEKFYQQKSVDERAHMITFLTKSPQSFKATIDTLQEKIKNM